MTFKKQNIHAKWKKWKEKIEGREERKRGREAEKRKKRGVGQGCSHRTKGHTFEAGLDLGWISGFWNLNPVEVTPLKLRCSWLGTIWLGYIIVKQRKEMEKCVALGTGCIIVQGDGKECVESRISRRAIQECSFKFKAAVSQAPLSLFTFCFNISFSWSLRAQMFTPG